VRIRNDIYARLPECLIYTRPPPRRRPPHGPSSTQPLRTYAFTRTIVSNARTYTKTKETRGRVRQFPRRAIFPLGTGGGDRRLLYPRRFLSNDDRRRLFPKRRAPSNSPHRYTPFFWIGDLVTRGRRTCSISADVSHGPRKSDRILSRPVNGGYNLFVSRRRKNNNRIETNRVARKHRN